MMELSYITRLGKTEFIDLINFCITKQNEKNVERGSFSSDTTVSNVVVHDEPDRRDLAGERYFWVCSYDGVRVLNGYVIKDFDMAIDNVGINGRETAADYTASMREFLTKRFGKEYIKAVYQHQVQEAEKEMNRLLECLPKEKRI